MISLLLCIFVQIWLNKIYDQTEWLLANPNSETFVIKGSNAFFGEQFSDFFSIAMYSTHPGASQ